MKIRFYDTPGPGGGGVTNERWPYQHIRICGDVGEDVIVHELAHAWTFANLSHQEREDITKLLGAATWDDHSYPWAERSIEITAETTTWALLGHAVLTDAIASAHSSTAVPTQPTSTKRCWDTRTHRLAAPGSRFGPGAKS